MAGTSAEGGGVAGGDGPRNRAGGAAGTPVLLACGGAVPLLRCAGTAPTLIPG